MWRCVCVASDLTTYLFFITYAGPQSLEPQVEWGTAITLVHMFWMVILQALIYSKEFYRPLKFPESCFKNVNDTQNHELPCGFSYKVALFIFRPCNSELSSIMDCRRFSLGHQIQALSTTQPFLPSYVLRVGPLSWRVQEAENSPCSFNSVSLQVLRVWEVFRMAQSAIWNEKMFGRIFFLKGQRPQLVQQDQLDPASDVLLQPCSAWWLSPGTGVSRLVATSTI